MPDETPLPEDELGQAIRRYIATGAAEGAAATARRLIQAVNIGLDDITAALEALGQDSPPQTITSSGSFSLAPIGFSGRGSLTHVKSGGGAAALSGTGTLVLSGGEVATTIEELRVVRQPDVEKLVTRPPVQWSKRELVLAAIVLIFAVYFVLPPAAQEHLLNGANLLQGIEAIVALLIRA